jgi:hypothetical protein
MSKRMRDSYFTNPYRMGHQPASKSSFEQIVQDLHLSPGEYATSAELKAWVSRHKSYKFVPPEVLEALGFVPGVEV